MSVQNVVGPSTVALATDTGVTGAEARLKATDRRAVFAAVKELDFPELKTPNHSLNITYDRETKQSIVQIVNRESGEVIQQFPGKDAVARARYYREISGL